MKPSEAKEVLLKVSLIWIAQPTDGARAMEWAETLAQVEFDDAIAGVREMRDSGRAWPPTPGEVYRAALAIERERSEDKRRRTRALPEPPPSPEEREMVSKMLSELREKMGKPTMAARAVDEEARRAELKAQCEVLSRK